MTYCGIILSCHDLVKKYMVTQGVEDKAHGLHEFTEKVKVTVLNWLRGGQMRLDMGELGSYGASMHAALTMMMWSVALRSKGNGTCVKGDCCCW